MIDVTYRIGGLLQLLEAERVVGAKTEGILTEHLRTLGKDVAESARSRYLSYSVDGAYGVQPKVFTSGLWVVQTKKKSRDVQKQRPTFGPLMMRKAFLPAARENEPRAAIAGRLAVEEAADLYWNGR